jgi:hypothetical protein
MRPLADAAVCRSEADWLVGINGTRAMTAFNSKTGGFHLTTVGRVQTPTLAILVEREEKIKKIVSKDYWEVHGTFAAQAGEYPGRWFDEAFQKPKEGETADFRSERLWNREKAESIREKCLGKPGIVTEEEHPGAGPSSLRKTQSADLSAHRLAGLAGGLHCDGPANLGDIARDALSRVRRTDLKERMGEAEQKNFQ